LTWRLSLLNPDSSSVTIDFDLNTDSSNDDFFPINCLFSSAENLGGIKVANVLNEGDEKDVKYAVDAKLVVEKYEIS